MASRWTEEEKEYLVKRVTKDGVHPRDVLDEMKEKFKSMHSWASVRSKLRELEISYAHLNRKSPITLSRVLVSEEQAREYLSKRGYKIEKVGKEKMDRRVEIDTSMFHGRLKRFAVISCTQLGSKYQQLTYLKKFYTLIQEEGIKVVLHCGDLVDGIDVYRGHEYELFLHGAEAQENYVVENYPKMENGGKTYVISGNHDYSFIKKAGIHILKNIARRREDIEFIGDYGAYPQILGLNIYMQHGKGGVSYARTYRLQKNIEQMSPAAKPDLYFLGHFHITAALFQYRNVIAFMIPCFQSQTPHLKQLGLYPEIGGLIIELIENDTVRKGGLAQMRFRWIPFYVPIKGDY